MPTQIVFSHRPVAFSIVEFNLDDGEEVFLTCSSERQAGPAIVRTGHGPPYMELIGGAPGEITTHPFGLRLGTWLIDDDMRSAEQREARDRLADAEKNELPPGDCDVLRRTVEELDEIESHTECLKKSHPNHVVIGQQGCGDLTMNLGHVAYINGETTRDGPELVCLPSEPINHRSYSCLVKWKQPTKETSQLSIEDVQFKRHFDTTNDMVHVRYGKYWLPRGDVIEFAVSNQQVIRKGQLVPAVTVCNSFADIRHLIQMPNLNPDGPLNPGEQPGSSMSYRPRKYFNRDQYGDIWLGEAALVADKPRNLLRAALAGPIVLELPPGADEERCRGALQREHYREVSSPSRPLDPGEWRFVASDPQVQDVEIYFRRNTYAWTMVGLSLDNRRILALACAGTPGVVGYTLEAAAQELRRAGAHNALLFDEGADVFQRVKLHGGLEDMVPRIRRRVRSTIVFARARNLARDKADVIHLED